MIVSETPQHVKDELLPGENITWIGQPNSRIAYMTAIPTTTIALLAAVYFFWDFMKMPSLAFQGPGLFFTAIFCFIFLGVLSTPFKMWMKFKTTYYVVTNNRYLVISGGRNKKVETYEKKLLTPLMKMTVMGLLTLVWQAPGVYTDSDGDTRRNTLWFAGIEPREIYNITSEEFPRLSELAKTMPPPR
ncbi:MAG: hypothetical protein KIT34_18380 [Cyanobacteria bacterium TGS_CYA1]|nr:hypothetical protein [Cyanobacteria bacterium TGS_CYA1]